MTQAKVEPAIKIQPQKVILVRKSFMCFSVRVSMENTDSKEILSQYIGSLFQFWSLHRFINRNLFLNCNKIEIKSMTFLNCNKVEIKSLAYVCQGSNSHQLFIY